MNGWFMGLILVPLVLAETGEVAPWLARRCLEWGARRLADEQVRDRYAEEWCADLEQVPGKLTKLGYAATVVLLSVPRLRWRTRRSEREVPGMRAAVVRAVAALDAVSDIDALANLIASGVVCSLGFRAIAVNLVIGDADLQCAAAVGPQEMRDQMLGSTCPRAAVDELLSRSTRRGTLRFMVDCDAYESDVNVYTREADQAAEYGPDSWRPEDGLLAPLYSPTGELLGMLSLDDPVTGRYPGPAHCAALEAYAAQAAARLFDLGEQLGSRSESN